MSTREDNVHRHIAKVNRYCTRCGGKMKVRLYQKNGETRYDPKTGKRDETVKVRYWACENAYMSDIVGGRTRWVHDYRSVPKR